MPRIVPLQLLKCLRVLLDDNGGILSAGEVKRIAGLMTKYSKKLVSKCIYVQILKCTNTELLGEFMCVGGWTLVYTWLNDAIRAMNWPLVQEILELLLLSPVDVNRLKINAAPKLVKGLCKEGGNEGVRILARRLVEQWLKVVTENSFQMIPLQKPEQPLQEQGAVAPISPASQPNQQIVAVNNENASQHHNVPTKKVNNARIDKDKRLALIEHDPLDTSLGHESSDTNSSYALTAAQKKANESGLVYKIIIKDGQQVLAKIPKPAQSQAKDNAKRFVDEEENIAETLEDDEIESGEPDEVDYDDEVNKLILDDFLNLATVVDASSATDKPQKEIDGSSSEEEHGKHTNRKSNTDKKRASTEQRKSIDENKARAGRSERTSSRDSKDSRDRKLEKDKDKDRKSSSYKSSSSSSSNHKSSSSSSKTNTSSSSSSAAPSKSKSSHTHSSSSHRSSSDKHRSDKERSSSSSSSKDKDRKEGSSSNSSSKQKSSSSSSSKSSSSTTASSSSSSKDRHRDKDKEKRSSPSTLSSTSSSSSSSLLKNKDKEVQAQKDKDTLAKMLPPSLDKLGKIPKKTKEDAETDASKSTTSFTIPSKKASMSIEVRRDSEKAKTVKTYKSQFRSHGLTEEAPPPPSRKSLKKPNTSITAPGTVLPSSLPSSLKRLSPTPQDSSTLSDKKAKLELNTSRLISNEKPGSIKLIPPKKIQTLIETNIFSDALSAATGPKKPAKRKRPSATGPSPPTSPVSTKVAPLKFYQDTLNESSTEDKSDVASAKGKHKNNNNDDDADIDVNVDKDNSTEDDDDVPLKKVKEDIEQQVRKEKDPSTIVTFDITSDQEDENEKGNEDSAIKAPRKPGPGCGPNGPPGVLMLHRRKGPKKKLTWLADDQLQQIRYFEVDETERVNVTKTNSFMDMKNMERFSERDAINMSRRGFNHEDNMEPQTTWTNLIMIDDVPTHPEGHQSKQRKVQADRELTTLRALYFTPAMIPDSPSEAELEPHFPYDIPVIPLDDITGNPDAVNDFTSMPWPEPKGVNKNDAAVNLVESVGVGGDVALCGANMGANPFNPFMSPYGAAQQTGPMPMQRPMLGARLPQPGWQQGPPPNSMMGPDGMVMMRNHFNNNPVDNANMDMGPPQNFMNPNGPFGPNGPFVPNGPQFVPNNFNGPFGPMGPINGMMGPVNGQMGPVNGLMGPVNNGPMGNTPMMNGMGPNMPPPPMLNGNMQRSNMNSNNNKNRNHMNNNNSGGNWRSGSNNYNNDNSGESRNGGGGSGGGGGGGNWRSAGSGHGGRSNTSGSGGGGGGGGGGNSGNSNGVCKGFMRGHCRSGKNCKFIHPKNKNRL